MKRWHLFSFILFMLLHACTSPEPSELQFTSPDGLCKVVVESTGGSWNSPAKVKTSVYAGEQALSSTVEIFHDQLTPDNCTLSWETGMGTLKLIHRDGEVREMEIHYTGEKLYMVDRKDNH